MDYIRAVDDYLHQPEFRYVERPAQPPAGDAPLDFFLNDSHEGYCQHFAGAMALLLRMGGLPARVATGFTPGGYSERNEAWIVRDTDAHAWVEVWFDAVRLGHARPDAGRHARPLAGRRAGRAALVRAARPRPRTPARDADEGGNGTQPSVRPELQVGPSDDHRDRRRRRRAASGWVLWFGRRSC